MRWLRAFGSGELLGDSFMRVAFLDDSGLGKLEHDPFVVIAGVVVNMDSQLKAIEHRLSEIKTAFFAVQSDDVVLHGTDILWGNRTFDKNIYSEDKRLGLLNDTIAIIAEFNLPVVMGVVDRRLRRIGNEKERIAYALKLASARCALAIEAYMRNQGSETCMLVYEDTPCYRKAIRDQHKVLNSEASSALSATYFPFQRIVHNPIFWNKSECALLQVADSAAFTFTRTFRKLGSGLDAKVMKPFMVLVNNLVSPQEEMLGDMFPDIKIQRVEWRKA
ncbi:MAG: DUF3800 domain-containing protein [Candidatus Hydrogenedentes bacterium]|nr:DUF3800 domain-containing protein [Candidatus Hydrogenedentota bacterium]